MASVVLGVFSERDAAEDAISELESRGYNTKDVSIMMKDTAESRKFYENTGASEVIGNTLGGAATGAVIGGIAGLAAAFIIPGLGVLFIGGPIAEALGLTGATALTASGATTGAVAGGIVGALTSAFGLSRKDAKLYEDRVKEGGILIAVPTIAGQEQEVRGIMMDRGVDNIRIVESPVQTREREGRQFERREPAYFSELKPKVKKGLKRASRSK